MVFNGLDGVFSWFSMVFGGLGNSFENGQLLGDAHHPPVVYLKVFVGCSLEHQGGPSSFWAKETQKLLCPLGLCTMDGPWVRLLGVEVLIVLA